MTKLRPVIVPPGVEPACSVNTSAVLRPTINSDSAFWSFELRRLSCIFSMACHWNSSTAQNLPIGENETRN